MSNTIEAIVQQMTFEEKASLLTGDADWHRRRTAPTSPTCAI